MMSLKVFCKNSFYISCFVLVLSIYRSNCADCVLGSLSYDPTILKTNNGQIQGACTQVPLVDPDQPGRVENVFTWLSIPYAEPPINQNRFKKPKPAQSWSGVRDGKIWPNRCMQRDKAPAIDRLVPLSEDCLYLNIFAPASVIQGKQLTPIFIFVHGGLFVNGSSSYSLLDSKALAALSNMIVVTINYRLSIFGFMYVDGTEISGNQGFLDQTMAFKWVYENALSFNGDPNKITIGGESSGSFSMGYHLIHPPSWKYFNSIIMESGSVLYNVMTFLPLEEASKRGHGILTEAGCGSVLSNPSDLLTCAQNISGELLQNISVTYRKSVILNNLIDASEQNPLFKLVQDGIEFKYSIKDSFEKNLYKKVNILSGYSNYKGDSNYTLNFTRFKSYLEDYFYYFVTHPTVATDEFKNSIINEYTKDIGQSDSVNYYNTLIQLLSEEEFICPTIDLARIISKYNNAFVYSFNNVKLVGQELGAVHYDELSFVFAEPLRNSSAANFNDNDRRLSKQIIRYWSNFVKYGDVNIYPSNEPNRNPYWPPFKSDLTIDFHNVFKNILSYFNIQYDSILPKRDSNYNNFMNLDINNISASNNFSFRHCDFWKNYNTYPNIKKVF